MLMYRAGAWWVRAYAPELSMGLQTAEEAADVYDARKDSTGSYSVDIDSLKTPTANPDDSINQQDESDSGDATIHEPAQPEEAKQADKKEPETEDVEQPRQPEEKPQSRQRRSRGSDYDME